MSWPVGYLGVFAVSFVGNMIPFGPAFYIGGVILATLDSTLNPILTVAFGAAGATLGKATVFRASGFLGPRRFKSWLQNSRLVRFVSRYGWIAAVLAAATPLPDDLVAIPLGLSGYNPWKFIASTFVGKSILIGLIVWGVRENGVRFAQLLQIM